MNGDYAQNRHLELLYVRRLPARLTMEQTARLLGFADHDIPILVRTRLLKCLGNPKQNSVKYFARHQLEELQNDIAWLSKATATIANYRRTQNEKARRVLPPT